MSQLPAPGCHGPAAALRAAGAAALALLLAACAQLPATPPATQALPPLARGLPPVPGQISQTLSAVFGEREATLACGLSVTEGGWNTVCVNPLGLRVFTLGVAADGSVTAERGAAVPLQLDPRRVLADVQLAYWPLAALQAAYLGTGWRVTEPEPDTRRLWLDERVVAEVHYAGSSPWNGRLWLVNLRDGYALGIRSESTPVTPR